MDIFEYIDRVKANYSKQPEPRYNTKKYFMGGSVTTPKRGLVDEPGSYSITAKEQKNIDAWNKKFKKEIKEGLIEAYEKQPKDARFYIRQGKMVGISKVDPNLDRRPIKQRNKKLFNKIVSLGKKGNIAIADILRNPEVVKLDKKKTVGHGTVKNILKKEIGDKKIDKILNLSTDTYITSADLNKVFSNIIKNNPNLETVGDLAKMAENELGKTTLYKKASKFVKDTNVNLVTDAERVLPEIKALDKIIKNNKNNFETIQTGVRSSKATEANQVFKNTAGSLANLVRVEMRKQFPNLSSGAIRNRLIKLNDIYSGKKIVGEEYYKDIKPPKNFKNSPFAKGLYAAVKTGGFQVSVVDEAKLLGLPQKDIDLLNDVSKGGTKLSKVKLAGDHTDSNALMKAVYDNKNFNKYKKDFMRINLISNELNNQKSIYDKRISNAYKNVQKGIIDKNQFNEIVSKTKKELFAKTKIPIGDPKFVDGKFEFNFATERLGDIDNPRNAAIKTAMNNLVKQSNVKFKGIDQKLRFAETPTERFNILKEASLESLKKSKFLKSFSTMKGNVGQAAKTLLSSKFGKYVVLPAAMYGAATTIASAEQPDVQEAAESFPTKTTAGATLAAGAVGTKTGRNIFGKTLKGAGTVLNKGVLGPLTALEAPSLALPQSAFELGNLIGDVKRGEKTDASAAKILLPTALSYAAASKQGLDLFADNAGKIKKALRSVVPFNPTLQNIARLSKGSAFLTPAVETAIQAYNAKKRLEEAKKKSSVFEPTVDTLLGDAPKSYYDEIMSEIPSEGRLKEFSIPFTDKKFTLPEVGVGEFQAASGGLANLTRTIPPEKGPQSQGLAYFMKNGKR